MKQMHSAACSLQSWKINFSGIWKKAAVCAALPALMTGPAAAVGDSAEIYSILVNQSLMFSAENLAGISAADIGRMTGSEFSELLTERDLYARYYDSGELKKITALSSDAPAGIGMDIFEDQYGNVRCAPYPGSPAEASGIFYPDILVSVDGKPAAGRTLQELAAMIRGAIDTDVDIEIKRDDYTDSFSIPRSVSRYPDVARTGKIPAVIKIFRFGNETARQLEQEIRKIEEDYKAQGYPPEKRFFIDLRGNTGGDLEQAALSASFFLPAGSTVYSYYDRDSESVYKTQQAGRYGGRPFIIMQDGYTASSAEMFINALKTGMKNVSTYGEQTYGKARVQKNFKLKSGAVLKLTVGELQYQDYTGTWESSGIAPDVVSRKDKEDGS